MKGGFTLPMFGSRFQKNRGGEGKAKNESVVLWETMIIFGSGDAR